MATIDRGYSNLLNILHSRPTSVPFNALVSGIVHYLVHTPTTQPSPAALVETIVRSQIWSTYSLKQYSDLGNAFGQALLSKAKQLKEQRSGLFSLSVSYTLQQWIDSVLHGVKSGSALPRLTIYKGILLGIDSLENAENLVSNRNRERIEKSAVLAFAEIIDQDREVSDREWLREFRPENNVSGGTETVYRCTREYLTNHYLAEVRNLAVILAAQYFTKLPTSVLLALNASVRRAQSLHCSRLTISLQSIVHLLLLTISSAFMDGKFLRDSDRAMSSNESKKIMIEVRSCAVFLAHI
jgi:hypothetical protein